MNILTVIPCHNDDSIRAERLIDQIFALNNKQPKGHALIVFAPSVQQENRDKIRISAELAFKSVSLWNVNLPKDLADKSTVVATLMALTAQHIAKHYRSPYLWLEPDCLPLKKGWLEQLASAYSEQPFRYMAGHVKHGDATALSRICICPADATKDFEQAAVMAIPFEFYAVALSSKSRLFQTVVLDSVEHENLIRPDAVLAHSDKRAVLVDKIVDRESKSPETNGEHVEIIAAPIAVEEGSQIPLVAPLPKKRGRPAKAVAAQPV